MYLKYEKYIGHFEAKNAQNGSKMGSKRIIDLNNDNNQKQPPEVFYKKLCSQKFRKIDRQTPAQGSQPATLLKKRLRHKCFPLNFAKYLKTPFLQNIPGRLLLMI